MNSEASQFRRNLVKVLAVQVVALLLLWLLQTAYAPRSETATPAQELGRSVLSAEGSLMGSVIRWLPTAEGQCTL